MLGNSFLWWAFGVLVWLLGLSWIGWLEHRLAQRERALRRWHRAWLRERRRRRGIPVEREL